MDIALRDEAEVGEEHPAEADRPLVSIVVPALNEETTVGEFIDWCWQGLDKAGVQGEILIVDSSMDCTGEIAEAKGARVLQVPKRGLGRAYIDASPHISVKAKLIFLKTANLKFPSSNVRLMS